MYSATSLNFLIVLIAFSGNSLRFFMHITKLPTNTYFFLFFITFILLISFSNFISWTSLKNNVIMNIFILFLNIKKWFLVLDALDNIFFIWNSKYFFIMLNIFCVNYTAIKVSYKNGTYIKCLFSYKEIIMYAIAMNLASYNIIHVIIELFLYISYL